MTTPTAFDPRTAGWSWAELGITEAEAQRIPVSAEVEAYSAKKAAPAIRGLIANPGATILQRVAAELVAMGVQVRYVDGWGSRGYLPLRPAGLINHWIVSTYRPGVGAPTLGLIVSGHSTLAGPLANLCLGFDGTVYVVAALSANHGGVGQWRGISGNDRWLGIECEGGPVLQPAQLAVLPRVNAAVGRAIHRDPASWCIGHHEYAPTRKVDIGSYMPPIRKEAARIYGGGAPAATVTTQEDDMQADERAALFNIEAALMRGGPDMPDAGRSIGASLANISNAVFAGGPSMPDDGRSVGKTLANLADVLYEGSAGTPHDATAYQRIARIEAEQKKQAELLAKIAAKVGA